MPFSRIIAPFSFIASITIVSTSLLANNDTWPSWRGQSLTGSFQNVAPPIEWSEEKNVKWKTQIPGSGLATPIIWKDQIFLLTAVEVPSADDPSRANRQSSARTPGEPGGFNRESIIQEFDKDGDGQLNDDERAAMRAQVGGGRRGGQGGRANRDRGPGGRGSRGGEPGPQKEHAFNVLAIDRVTGDILWTQTAIQQKPHEGHHATHGFASASPVTDGSHLWASFGSRGFYCYTLNGDLVWKKDLGDLRSRGGFGEAITPVIAGDKLLIVWDQEDQSYLYALDKLTGEVVWRKERDERTSWTTPVIVEFEGQTQAIVAGTNKSIAYNPENGDIIWEASGLTSNVIPTPVIGNDLVYLVSGYKGRSVQAIKLSSKGDVSDSENIVWSAAHSAPYVASPLLSNNRLYMNKSNDAYFACFDALTGEVLYQDEKIEGIRGIYASPIAANGHIYILGKEGTTVVIKDSDTFEIIATNTLSDPIDASPIVLGNELFIRSHTSLYCIADKS